MFATTVTRPIRLILAVLAIAMAGAAMMPALSAAAPNNGGGPNPESPSCQTLRDRLQRYHDIATDPRQPKSVRAFYKARAAATLHRAQQLGCSFVAIKAAAKATTTPGGQTPQSRPTASRIKATHTGNSQQDEYCSGVAKLAEEAEREGDRQSGLGNDGEAQAWWDLADRYVDEATQNGCRFTFLKVAPQARLQAAGTVLATKA